LTNGRISLSQINQKIEDLKENVNRGFARNTEKLDKLTEMANENVTKICVLEQRTEGIENQQKKLDSPFPNFIKWIINSFK